MSFKIAFLGFSFLVAFIFLVTIPAPGAAKRIQCFECNSKSNGTCADPFYKSKNEMFLVTCKKDGFCRKQYQNIQDEVRVVRSCGYEWNKKYEDGACRQTNSETLRLLDCQCKGKECNSATIPAASALTALLPALLLYTLRQ